MAVHWQRMFLLLIEQSVTDSEDGAKTSEQPGKKVRQDTTAVSYIFLRLFVFLVFESGRGGIPTRTEKTTRHRICSSWITYHNLLRYFQKKVPILKIEGIELPYFEVSFEDGTPCDLTGQPRRASIRYVCQEDGKGEIYEFKELSTCEYAIVVLTSHLCSHPAYEWVRSCHISPFFRCVVLLASGSAKRDSFLKKIGRTVGGLSGSLSSRICDWFFLCMIYFRPKKEPINEINCHSLTSSPTRPVSLQNLERENRQGQYNRRVSSNCVQIP